MNNEYPLKKVALFILFFIALIAIPLTVYLAQRQQSTQSKAAVVSESAVVAIIDGQQITMAQVRKVAEEQMDPASVNSEALKVALGVIEERMILDKAAADIGIVVDSAKVDELTAQEISETDARYEALKEQITEVAVKNRQALSIQFWSTPESGLSGLTAAEKTAAENQLADGIPALSEARTALEDGDDVLETGESILTKYSSLKTVLAVNGNILDGLTESERAVVIQNPQVYQFGDSGLDQETQTALFDARVDEVILVTDTPTNRGGIVFKVVSVNETGVDTFDQWYTQQRASLVQNLNVL